MKRFEDFVALWGAVVGSLLLALNVSVSGWGYVFFFASSVASVRVLMRSNLSKALLQQQAFFTVVNVVGVVRWVL